MTFLAVERGKDAGKRYELKNFPVTIGRDSSSNTIAVNDGEASRQHIRIKKRGRLYILEDLESRNGTYVNGDKVVNTTLKSGDKILMGSTELTFFAPDSEITIPTDYLSFDMQIDDKAGISGPIGIQDSPTTPFSANRIDPGQLSNGIMSNDKSIKQVFNYHSNLMVIRDINELCNTILKSIGKIVTNSSRAALFIWSSKSRQLLPFAKKDFHLSVPFQLSKRAFEDCLARKQVVLLEPNTKTTQPGRNRAILPILHNDEVVAIVHIEIDNPKYKYRTSDLEIAQALMFRASPILETLLLRKEIDSWLFGIMDTIVATVEAKDTYTRGHSERVAGYCMAIADELKLTKDIKKLLMVSALCHDIGKIGIPDSILKKASLLSAEEYAEMKLHPTIGANIISHLPNSKRILSGVKYHHEKWDGTGYPDGLAGEEIPFFGRIVAIGDVFDAMISGRSYSGFINENDAIEKIYEERELFDPEIVKAITRAHDKGTLSSKTSTQNKETPDDDDTRVTEITKIK